MLLYSHCETNSSCKKEYRTCITYPNMHLQNSEGPRLESLGISGLIVLSNFVFQFFQKIFPVTHINTVENQPKTKL